MSRIGKHAVPVPAGVDVAVDGQKVSAKGKLGALEITLNDLVVAKLEKGEVSVTPANDSRQARAMWGTWRTRVANLVKGVADGFSEQLEIEGVGFRAAVQGKDLVLQLGFSHEVRYPIPAGIAIKCDKPTLVTISGADKQQVGQVAAEIRAMRKPEPYKGKGVRYSTEKVRRKEGKKK